MFRWSRLLLLVVLVVPLYSCGKKGPLYLPEPNPARTDAPAARLA